jgi:hypothetical protein
MATLKETASKVGTEAQKARNTKSTRLWFIGLISAIVFVLWYFKIIKTGFAVGIGILLLAAFGIEAIDYDLDLATLWQTGNVQESRVQHTKDGIVLKGSCINSKKENDLDCANFQSQAEAQAKYDTCAEQVASYNAGSDIAKIKSLDIYGLDRDKDGMVCESLPRGLTPAQ